MQRHAADATTIDRIWQITKAIEHAAAVGEWEEAARLADERSPLILSLYSPLSPAALETLRQVYAIDEHVAEVAQNAHHTLNAEFRAAMQATRNVSVYQKIAHL
ncbi:MAG TPA: flagellar protein FliT [Paraburkholderia sp.]|nr:flagellar protein FliT [Paraburkholderia sp.]